MVRQPNWPSPPSSFQSENHLLRKLKAPVSGRSSAICYTFYWEAENLIFLKWPFKRQNKLVILLKVIRICLSLPTFSEQGLVGLGWDRKILFYKNQNLQVKFTAFFVNNSFILFILSFEGVWRSQRSGSIIAIYERFDHLKYCCLLGGWKVITVDWASLAQSSSCGWLH